MSNTGAASGYLVLSGGEPSAFFEAEGFDSPVTGTVTFRPADPWPPDRPSEEPSAAVREALEAAGGAPVLARHLLAGFGAAAVLTVGGQLTENDLRDPDPVLSEGLPQHHADFGRRARRRPGTRLVDLEGPTREGDGGLQFLLDRARQRNRAHGADRPSGAAPPPLAGFVAAEDGQVAVVALTRTRPLPLLPLAVGSVWVATTLDPADPLAHRASLGERTLIPTLALVHQDLGHPPVYAVRRDPTRWQTTKKT